MSCNGRTEQILLYVTDGLDEAERDELDAHLQIGCTRCLSDISTAREMTGWLALAPRPEQPDPSVKERLMQQVEQDLSLRDSSGGQTPAGRSRHPESMRHDRRPLDMFVSGPSSPMHRPRRLIKRMLWPAAAVIVATVVTYAILTVELRDARQQFAQLGDEVNELKQDLTSSDAQLSDMKSLQQVTNDFWELVRSHESEFVELQSRDEEHSYWARLFIDMKEGICFLVPGRTGPFQRDRQYVMLLNTNDNTEPVQAAEFTFDPDRPTRFNLQLPDDPRGYTKVSIREVVQGNDGVNDQRQSTEVLFGTLGLLSVNDVANDGINHRHFD